MCLLLSQFVRNGKIWIIIHKLRGFFKNVYLLVVHGKMLLETNGVTKRIPLHQRNHIQTG